MKHNFKSAVTHIPVTAVVMDFQSHCKLLSYRRKFIPEIEVARYRGTYIHEGEKCD